MQTGKDFQPRKGGFFNTLAQNGTTGILKLPIQVRGKGIDLANNPTLPKKAKRKTISNCMVKHLIKVAKEKGDYEIQKSLWNTWHCQQRIFETGGKLHATYCKNRFCTGCLAIRKAEIVNKYLPIMETWPDPFFLTLTIKAPKADDLSIWLDKMENAMQTIIGRYRKRHQRGKGIKLVGLRSLECNFNPIERTYNPHFHLILPNLEIADTLLREWPLYWNDPKICTKGAQDNRRVKAHRKTEQLIELVKYGTKIFTVEDTKAKNRKGLPHHLYVAALYNIFVAMKGRRLFERFGFNLPRQTANKQRIKKQVDNYTEYRFNPKLNDWTNVETSQQLSNYVLPPELNDLLENRIDTKTA